MSDIGSSPGHRQLKRGEKDGPLDAFGGLTDFPPVDGH